MRKQSIKVIQAAKPHCSVSQRLAARAADIEPAEMAAQVAHVRAERAAAMAAMPQEAVIRPEKVRELQRNRLATSQRKLLMPVVAVRQTLLRVNWAAVRTEQMASQIPAAVAAVADPPARHMAEMAALVSSS